MTDIEWTYAKALKDWKLKMQHQKAAEDFGRACLLAYYHSLAMICYKNLTQRPPGYTQCRRIVETVDADLLRSDDDK
jgi:hypothetical protein